MPLSTSRSTRLVTPAGVRPCQPGGPRGAALRDDEEPSAVDALGQPELPHHGDEVLAEGLDGGGHPVGGDEHRGLRLPAELPDVATEQQQGLPERGLDVHEGAPARGHEVVDPSVAEGREPQLGAAAVLVAPVPHQHALVAQPAEGPGEGAARKPQRLDELGGADPTGRVDRQQDLEVEPRGQCLAQGHLGVAGEVDGHPLEEHEAPEQAGGRLGKSGGSHSSQGTGATWAWGPGSTEGLSGAPYRGPVRPRRHLDPRGIGPTG
jgi:hypothetical protein